MQPKAQHPPRLAGKLLTWFLRKDLAEEVQGDLEERFQRKLERTTSFRANIDYWYQVLHYLRPFAIKKTAFPMRGIRDLLVYDLKIGRRIILREKSYSFLNIGGLALGMAVAVLISLWVYDEYSHNWSFDHYDRIAKLSRFQNIRGHRYVGHANPAGLAEELRSRYGDLFERVVLATGPEAVILSKGEQHFRRSGRFMEPHATELLSLPMLSGNRSALEDHNAVLLSSTAAKAYFGEHDPLFETLTLDGGEILTIKGVFEDFPSNSDFNDVDFIAPFAVYQRLNNWVNEEWNNWSDSSFPIYVQLAEHTSFEAASQQIKDILRPHIDADKMAVQQIAFFLHPMRDWRLFSKFEDGLPQMSETLKSIYIYALIGLFVLILAAINFMNLSTARAERRALEVGVRKTFGSRRDQLIRQFLVESWLMSVFAFLLAIGLVYLLLPWFNSFSGKTLRILWEFPAFWMIGLAFVFVVAVLAGSYPAFYLSGLQPMRVIKSGFVSLRSAAKYRGALVVFQFGISITLILCTLVIYQQIQYAKDRPLGYNRDHLLTVPKSTGLFGKEDRLKNALLESGAVLSVAESASKLTEIGSNNPGLSWPGKDPTLPDPEFGTLGVSYDFGKTVGWEFIAGRDFSAEQATDSSGLILTRSAVKVMGLEDPLGANIRSELGWHEGRELRVIGVVEDMVIQSPFEQIHPCVFFLQGAKPWLQLRLNPDLGMRENLSTIEAAFQEITPDEPFSYEFVDETFAEKFAAEERLGQMAGFFAFLAIFISCLGIFGLATYMVNRRRKEIGIRKVLGATVRSIWGMLSKNFLLLVLYALLPVLPLAYYLMQAWLQQYHYRIDLSLVLFGLVGLAVLVLTLITVSFSAVKAALANPVYALKSE